MNRLLNGLFQSTLGRSLAPLAKPVSSQETWHPLVKKAVDVFLKGNLGYGILSDDKKQTSENTLTKVMRFFRSGPSRSTTPLIQEHPSSTEEAQKEPQTREINRFKTVLLGHPATGILQEPESNKTQQGGFCNIQPTTTYGAYSSYTMGRERINPSVLAQGENWFMLVDGLASVDLTQQSTQLFGQSAVEYIRQSQEATTLRANELTEPLFEALKYGGGKIQSSKGEGGRTLPGVHIIAHKIITHADGTADLKIAKCGQAQYFLFRKNQDSGTYLLTTKQTLNEKEHDKVAAEALLEVVMRFAKVKFAHHKNFEGIRKNTHGLGALSYSNLSNLEILDMITLQPGDVLITCNAGVGFTLSPKELQDIVSMQPNDPVAINQDIIQECVRKKMIMDVALEPLKNNERPALSTPSHPLVGKIKDDHGQTLYIATDGCELDEKGQPKGFINPAVNHYSVGVYVHNPIPAERAEITRRTRPPELLPEVPAPAKITFDDPAYSTYLKSAYFVEHGKPTPVDFDSIRDDNIQHILPLLNDKKLANVFIIIKVREQISKDPYFKQFLTENP